MPNDNNTFHAEVIVPVKYLSNFCKSLLDLPLINWKNRTSFVMFKIMYNIRNINAI